jgi:DNA modification methylase
VDVTARIICGDCLDVLKTLPAESVNCCVTSPPYWGLRDYGVDGQIGLEETPEAYVARLVDVFREVRRVLKDDGTLWLNLGDTYWGGKGTNGTSRAMRTAADRGWTQSPGTPVQTIRPQDRRHPVIKTKDLVGIPWRVAFALQADGWYLRQDIIWHKPNPMPESVRDRCTKAHEYLFLLSKAPRYWFDHDEMTEPAAYGANGSRFDIGKTLGHQGGRTSTKPRTEDGTRNRRDVWTVATKPYAEAHFATFPPDLIRPCVCAGCPVGGVVLDPFAGAGTTGLVALEEGRDFLGIELNPEYVALAEKRLAPLTEVRRLDTFFEEVLE